MKLYLPMRVWCGPHWLLLRPALARMLSLVLALALPLTLALTAASAQTQTQTKVQAQGAQSLPGGFTADQVEGVEHIIRQYLLEHPEVLVDALTTYQQRQRMAEQERQKAAVLEQRAALTQDADTPVLGNPDGDVTIVEFFDYRCSYCRRVVRDLHDVVKDDGKVRLVMKEFPILGPASIRAARAALAAVAQDKYGVYHFALMTQPGDMSDPHLMQVARLVGLDPERLQADMESEEIDRLIRRNLDLAETLGVNGTPAFVIGDTLVPGAIDADTMRELIAKARDKAS